MTSFGCLGAFPSAGVRPMAYSASLDCLFGLLTQRWDSPIIILYPYIVPDRVSVLTDENTKKYLTTAQKSV